MTEATCHKHLQNGLADEINKIRKCYIEENFKRLEYASGKSVNVLLDILEDENCSKSIKLNTAKLIIEYTLKAREQDEIISRLNNIEKRINEKC